MDNTTQCACTSKAKEHSSFKIVYCAENDKERKESVGLGLTTDVYDTSEEWHERNLWESGIYGTRKVKICTRKTTILVKDYP